MIKNYSDYKQKTKETIKAMLKLLDELRDSNSEYRPSRDIKRSLNEAIFQLGRSIAPAEWDCTVDGLRKYL